MNLWLLVATPIVAAIRLPRFLLIGVYLYFVPILRHDGFFVLQHRPVPFELLTVQEILELVVGVLLKRKIFDMVMLMTTAVIMCISMMSCEAFGVVVVVDFEEMSM